MAYRGHSPPPPRGPERWDRSRYDAYSRGGPPVVERDRYEEVDYYARPREEPEPRHPRRVEEMYYYDEKDRYEIPHRPRREYARYHEEEGSQYEGAMVPARHRDEERELEIDIRRREYDRHSPHPPPRPQFVRRQSSLDTFDRKPMPRYGDRVREEVIQIPAGSRRRSPPRYRSPPHFVERDYEEVRVMDPEYYGDEEFRGYREREISRVRRNGREYEVEEEKEEVVESEFPKRGKTKMPMRLVNKQAIIQLGYSFEEEGETIIILKALGKEHIDEVIKISRELNSKPAPLPAPPVEETRTTYVIEHPPAPPPPPSEEKVVERRTEIIRELPPSPPPPNPNPPRSVKEWDVLSHESSHHESHRSPSPSGTHRTHHSRKSSRSHHTSRARSVSSASTRRELIIAEDREESATVRAGVGALIVPGRERRTERDIKAEIRELERERKALKLEREVDRLRVDDRDSRDRELIVVKERDDEVVEVRKDRKGRLSLVR